MWRSIHGIDFGVLYAAAMFKNLSGAPILDKGKANTIYMDAFASSTHIGMIYTANTSQGQDRIIEAKGEAYGTGKWIRNYRGNSTYEGAERSG